MALTHIAFPSTYAPFEMRTRPSTAGVISSADEAGCHRMESEPAPMSHGIFFVFSFFPAFFHLSLILAFDFDSPPPYC